MVSFLSSLPHLRSPRQSPEVDPDAMPPKSGMGWDPQKMNEEVWKYYLARRDGSIPERPYDSWGPDEYDRSMPADIIQQFGQVRWDTCYAGRGVPRPDQEYQWWMRDVICADPDKVSEIQKPYMLDARTLRKLPREDINRNISGSSNSSRESRSLAQVECTKHGKSILNPSLKFPAWAKQSAFIICRRVHRMNFKPCSKRKSPATVEQHAKAE